MKRIFLVIVTVFIIILNVYSKNNDFIINTSKINLMEDSKNKEVTSNFNSNYMISYNKEELKTDDAFEKQMTTLTKEATHILLGKENNKNESYIDFAKRREALKKLRYAPKVPVDINGDLIEDSQEYKDDNLSGINLPGMFYLLAEQNVTYKELGATKVRKIVDDGGGRVITEIALSGVKMEVPNKDEPMKIDTIDTNVIITYIFKPINNVYKLLYIMFEYDMDIDSYFQDLEASEDEGSSSLNMKYKANVDKLYSYSKLDVLGENTIKSIFDKNIDNVVMLNTYYENSIKHTGNGFFIGNGLIMTTWNYIQKSLLDGQYLIIRDNKNNLYEMAGIVTASPELDIAIIKLKDYVQKSVVLGNSKDFKIEDPVLLISSKSGFGLSISSGIVISTGSKLNSILPLRESDEGSPLFNSKGEVIGINTVQSLNSNISIAVASQYIKEFQGKFENINFKDIQYVTFDTLKEKYYYEKYANEKITNKIDKKIWNSYKKIGNIEKSIKLNLVKASYFDGILSLRYSNKIRNLITNMQMAAVFKGNLIDDKYKLKVDSNQKAVLENNKYKIIIMDEFDYLIILMIRK